MQSCPLLRRTKTGTEERLRVAVYKHQPFLRPGDTRVKHLDPEVRLQPAPQLSGSKWSGPAAPSRGGSLVPDLRRQLRDGAHLVMPSL